METVRFSAGALAGLTVQGALMMLIPVVLLVLWMKKTREKILPVIVGAAAWFVFAIILKLAPAYFLIQADNPVSRAVNSSPWLLYAVAGILAGVFEETARYLSFKFVLKKYEDRRAAISYGIGHGGFESVYVGFQTLSVAFLGMIVNSGLISRITAGMNGDQLFALFAQLGEYADLPFAECLLGVFERLPAIVLHISLSVLVFAAVRRKRYFYLYPASVAVHALFDFSIALYASGILPSWALELLFACLAAAVAFFASRVYKTLGENEIVIDGSDLRTEE